MLGEVAGLRVAPVLLSVRALPRLNRSERIRRGVQEMSDEEACCWFGEITSGPEPAWAQHALRALLAGE